MRDDFLKRFIEEEQYQQNPPLDTSEFIKFCSGRGIKTNEKELEFFEREGLLYPLFRIERPIIEEELISFHKNGESYSRPIEEGLNNGEIEKGRFIHRYYSGYDFSDRDKAVFLAWIEDGILHDPARKPFKQWSSFEGEKLFNGSTKTVSLYSPYQIFWLNILKLTYSISINLAGDVIWVSSPIFGRYHDSVGCGSFGLNSIDDFANQLKKHDQDKFKNYFNLEIKKARLKNNYQEFNKLLEFLLSIQSVYAPYGKSSSKYIHITHNGFDSDMWPEKRQNFNPKEKLEELNITIEFIIRNYELFSYKCNYILGNGRSHDWLLLWKDISWDKKDILEGDIRYGIEYLQVALILKRFIEDHLGRDILDIDEVIKTLPKDVLEYDPSTIKGRDNLRGVRNDRLSDDKKSYYGDKYKRLFYLSNEFHLDYQPRVIVFVEGKTEEETIPRFFKWYHGDIPQDHGIDFINFKGVDKLLSTSKVAEDLMKLTDSIERQNKDKFLSSAQKEKLGKLINDLRNTNVILSNWTTFLSYNLEKWQIIPFFISDLEGGIMRFLDPKIKLIDYNGNRYGLPEEWRFIWGMDNNNTPFFGNSFEFANFSDDEIAFAISEVSGEKIEIETVKTKRHNGYSINKINDKVKANKSKINNTMLDNLIKTYSMTKDKAIFERPIFKVIEKILRLESLNHLPVDRKVEAENKKIMEEILKGIRHLL